MMHKVLAVIEIEISAPDDATDAAICESFGDLCALLPHHLQRLGDLDEDYQDDVIYTDITPLNVKVLNSTLSSALNHLYPRHIFDMETRSPDDTVYTFDTDDKGDTSIQFLGATSIISRPLQAGGPAPTRDEALLLFGVNPDVLAVEIRPEPPFTLSSERDSAFAQTLLVESQNEFEKRHTRNEPSNRVGYREGRNMAVVSREDLMAPVLETGAGVGVYHTDDPEETGTTIVWYTSMSGGLSADSDGKITQYRHDHTGRMMPIDRDPGIHPIHAAGAREYINTESPTGRMVPTYPAPHKELPTTVAEHHDLMEKRSLEDCKQRFHGNPTNFEGLDPNMFDIGKKMIDFFRNPFAKETAGTKDLDAKLRSGTVSGRVSHKVPNGPKHPNFTDAERNPTRQEQQISTYAALYGLDHARREDETVAILSRTIANEDLENVINNGTKLNDLWPDRVFTPVDIDGYRVDPTAFRKQFENEWPSHVHDDDAARSAVEAPTSVVNDAKVDEPSRSYEPSVSSYESPSSSSDSYSSSSDSSSDSSSSSSDSSSSSSSVD